MRLRGATGKDHKAVLELYNNYGFTLDVDHLESIVVVEDDSKTIIAVGSLVKLLEGSFLVDRSLPLRDRAAAFKLVMKQVDIEAANLGFDAFHTFVTNLGILNILKKKFKFKLSIGTPMIKWVKNG